MSDGAGAGAAELPRWALFAALVLLLVGTGLRLWRLDESSLFIDEGETCLNALSILERGYPASDYNGLPMFENTLTEAWPESEEYEFRDTSYSREGMAIYHGWLPLYAIAASFALHGIHPDGPTQELRVKYGAEEIRERIRAARLPSVFFGVVFLLAIFRLGRAVYGVDAGLAALLAAALAPKCIWLAQQARYYSATLALGTLAACCAWTAVQRGRWRDFLASGVVFVLLFHTSSLAFVVLSVACVALLPRLLTVERARAKLACWAVLVTLGLLPWMLWTGFLESSGRIPMARSLLEFPAHYLLYLRGHGGRTIAGACAVALIALLWFRRATLPARVARGVDAAALPVCYLLTWMVAAYLGFLLLIPAASCSLARISQFLVPGAILLVAIGITLLARMLWPSRAAPAACLTTLGLMASTGNVLRGQEHNPYETRAVFEMVEYLRELPLTRDTRLYALPYQHFCLAFYTGLPIQSIAPVRPEYLDDYPGEVLILETSTRILPPRPENVQRRALEAGVDLDADEALGWVPALNGLMIRAEVEPLVRDFTMVADGVPTWVADVVPSLRRDAELPGRGYFDFAADNPAMFAGLAPMTIDDFWPQFFYCFMDPSRRSGDNLNYAGRMREARAVMLPSTWIVLHCPARPGWNGAD